MKKKTIYWILALLIIGGAVIYFYNKNKKEEPKNDSNTVQEEKKETEEEKKEEPKKDTPTKVTSNRDFSSYSSNSQTVGEDSESKYTIESISDSSKDGYHEISFKLSSEGEDYPFVTASYVSAAGVIRVKLNNIEKDSAGIAHQSSKAVNVDGISKIYRNISNIQDEEIYDIGIAPTVFKLVSEKEEDGKWNVLLLVKYTEKEESTSENDLGSTEFSSKEQSISGVGESEKASVTSYTYGTAGGVVKFVWNVTADGNSPIPSVKAGYDESGKLVVEFSSLVLDRVALAKEIVLNSRIKLVASRTGSTSTYVFEGVSKDTEFKLSASTNPNQVSIEIK